MRDWDEYSVIELANAKRELFNDGDWIEAPYITSSGTRLLQTGNVGVGRLLNRGTKRYISDRSYRLLKCKEVIPGDILICRLADPAGRACLVHSIGEKRMVTSVDVTIYRPDPQKADRRFLVAMFSTDYWFREVSERCGGSTRTRIARSELGRIKLRVPRLEEQQHIAEALGDADASIAALERLITKKQAIKQGMMQELLTGRTRLPGFSMPWRTEALGAVSDIDPETIPSETSHSEMIDYVSLEDVSRGRILASSRVKFGNAPSRARRAVRPLDVIFGTVRPNLQSHALYRGGLRKPVVSTGFAVIRARSSLADPQFLFYLVMSSLTSSQVERIIAGSNYPAVSSRDVRIFEYLLPDITEQEAIGAALADAEAELTVLHARLQKARAIKQGMMQELLTGRSRLPVPEAVA